GMIAPMVAGDHNVGFIILMAAPTVPGKDLLLKQTERILETMDFSEEEVTRRKNINEEIYDEVIKENTDTSIIKQSFQKLSQSDELTVDSAAMQAQMTQQMKAVLSPWIQFFLSYNPAPQLKTLDIPVLALFGKKDVQVDSRQNKILIRDMIDQGKENYTLKIFPHANHLFQHADTGSMQEYQQLPKEFTDEFLKYITDWAEQAVR
ncbi:MAG: alpha/beta hydrolase family protein, partial [Bacteroidota bacterium]